MAKGRATPSPRSLPVPGTGQPHVQVLSWQHPVIHSSLGAQPPFRLQAGRAEGGINPSPALGQAIPGLPAPPPPSHDCCSESRICGCETSLETLHQYQAGPGVVTAACEEGWQERACGQGLRNATLPVQAAFCGLPGLGSHPYGVIHLEIPFFCLFVFFV